MFKNKLKSTASCFLEKENLINIGSIISPCRLLTKAFHNLKYPKFELTAENVENNYLLPALCSFSFEN